MIHGIIIPVSPFLWQHGTMIEEETDNVLTEDLPQHFFVQQHRPLPMRATHIHRHVEVNLLEGCTVTYLIPGGTVVVPPERIVVFWGQLPHRVVKVEGNGRTTIVYIPFGDLVRWPLPDRFSRALMKGAFLYARESDPDDARRFGRWYGDSRSGDPVLTAIVRDEVQLRLRRLAHAGWEETKAEGADASRVPMRSLGYVEAMTRFIADHYRDAITVEDVAGHAGVSSAYAMALFSKSIGMPIGRYITRLRLGHAQALLVDSDTTITTIALDSGFHSLSRFYDAFGKEFRTTPRAYRKAARHRTGAAQRTPAQKTPAQKTTAHRR